MDVNYSDDNFNLNICRALGLEKVSTFLPKIEKVETFFEMRDFLKGACLWKHSLFRI